MAADYRSDRPRLEPCAGKFLSLRRFAARAAVRRGAVRADGLLINFLLIRIFIIIIQFRE
jgi:hypothetical protein